MTPNTRTVPSRSMGEIGRLASRALSSGNLAEPDRHDLEEILQIARRARIAAEGAAVGDGDLPEQIAVPASSD